jgi:hypothetical protein
MSSDRLLSKVVIGTMTRPREGGSESMPLYEIRDNAANRIVVDEAVRRAITTGLRDAAGRILQVIKACATGRDRVVGVAFDGWYGVDWQPVLEALAAAARPGMLSLSFGKALLAKHLYRSRRSVSITAARNPGWNICEVCRATAEPPATAWRQTGSKTLPYLLCQPGVEMGSEAMIRSG